MCAITNWNQVVELLQKKNGGGCSGSYSKDSSSEAPSHVKGNQLNC